MAKEELVCRCYSCVGIIVSRDVKCESGECFMFVRVGSWEVAVFAARLGWLAIQNGTKLVTSKACVLQSPSLSVAFWPQTALRGLTCEAT